MARSCVVRLYRRNARLLSHHSSTQRARGAYCDFACYMGYWLLVDVAYCRLALPAVRKAISRLLATSTYAHHGMRKLRRLTQ